jgi:hypothetical protein
MIDNPPRMILRSQHLFDLCIRLPLLCPLSRIVACASAASFTLALSQAQNRIRALKVGLRTVRAEQIGNAHVVLAAKMLSSVFVVAGKVVGIAAFGAQRHDQRELHKRFNCGLIMIMKCTHSRTGDLPKHLRVLQDRVVCRLRLLRLRRRRFIILILLQKRDLILFLLALGLCLLLGG